MLKRILVATGIMATLPAAHAGGFFFDPPVNLGTPNANSVAVGDFNGDQRDDVAAVVAGRLEVMLQDASGSLTAPLILEIPGVEFITVRQADLGADGTTEILVGHSNGLAVYRWNGAGGFALDNHPAQTPCEFLATGDISLDGAPDVFCHEHYSNASIYYSGQGGVLQPPVYMRTALYLPRPTDGGSTVMQPQVKDVTGDGRADLVLASGMSNSFFVYPNDGVGGFLPPTAYAYPEEDEAYSDAVEVADIDGDGANEVLVAKPENSPRSEVLVYRRGAQGYLTLWKRLASYDLPAALLVFDIDHDGHQDLLVGHPGWFAVGRYMGQGQALSNVERLSNFVQTMWDFDRYALGDLDHDGFTDLAVANAYGVSVLYGRRRATYDFDGDGVSDVLWRYPTGKNAIWQSADAKKPINIDAVDPAWSAEATGDFNGYGETGIFWRNLATGGNQIQWSTYPGDVTGVTTQDWQVVGAGDFDGDDRSDLLWRNELTGANTIWKSAYSATQQLTTGVTDLRWKVVGVGDFDGDGRSDILWRHSVSGANAVWLAGRASTQQATAGVANLAWQVAGVGDFDGDGKDDVVWRNGSTGANAIWRSANAATQQSVMGVTNLAWTIAAVGDYNGDGHSDLLWRNVKTGANVIWRSADALQQQAMAAVLDLHWKIIR